MKTLYIDCAMGAAGDMLTAALLDLADKPEEYLKELDSLELPGISYVLEPAVQKGVKGSRVKVIIGGSYHSENGDESCENSDHHHHHHEHRSLAEVLSIIDASRVPEQVKNDAKNVYRMLAEAESKAHGEPVTEIHFHEVGMLDAIADITAACYLMRSISPDRVICSPVNVGNGTVKCAHGVMNVPAPATELLLQDIPSYRGVEKSDDAAPVFGELCTPTGAVLLKYHADEFCRSRAEFEEKLRSGEIAHTGHGMGSKEFETAANCVSIYVQDGV